MTMSVEEFLDLEKQRRSTYALGRDVKQTDAELEEMFQQAIAHAPSAFNSQTPRAVFAFGEKHIQLWDAIIDTMRAIVPEDAFAATEAKLEGFKAGYGTVLMFTETDTVKNLEENFPTYADNFYDWSEQGQGFAQMAMWMVTTAAGLGANLQHYNPVIDDAVQDMFGTPDSWRLRTQFVFGSIESPAGEKEFLPTEERFKSAN